MLRAILIVITLAAFALSSVGCGSVRGINMNASETARAKFKPKKYRKLKIDRVLKIDSVAVNFPDTTGRFSDDGRFVVGVSQAGDTVRIPTDSIATAHYVRDTRNTGAAGGILLGVAAVVAIILISADGHWGPGLK